MQSERRDIHGNIGQVALLVTDGASEPYPLKLPSRLTAAGWVSSAKGTPLAVTPVKWKPYIAPRPAPKKKMKRRLDRK
jgi:hypothetical protein